MYVTLSQDNKFDLKNQKKKKICVIFRRQTERWPFNSLISTI